MVHTEKQILDIANTRDKVLYKHLYDAFYAALCRYAARLLRDVAPEEDVVQDVFMRFWEADTVFKDERALTTYLYRSVYNASLNLLRDRKEINDNKVTELLTDFNSADNERLLIEDEYFRQIYVVIDTLPYQRRQIILKTLEGKKNEEIAFEMNVSVNTVKTLKKKAYKELREKLPSPLFYLFLLSFL